MLKEKYMFKNSLFDLIEKYNLEDELFEIFPPDKEAEQERKKVFNNFIQQLENNEILTEERVAKLVYLYFQSKELRENFINEFPEYLSGLYVISDIIIERIRKNFLENNINLDKVKNILKVKYNIDSIYNIFVNYPYDLIEIFDMLLDENEKNKAIKMLKEQNNYELIIQFLKKY